jgi:FkbM family methyltransferase
MQNETLFNEVITENTYILSVNDLKNKFLLDVGANRGYFSLIAAECGAKQIISVEPDEQLYNQLGENIKNYENILPLNFAVYDESKEYVSLEGIDGETKVSDIDNEDSKVKTITLHELLKYMPDKNDLVLKMDCEGSEHEILYSSSRSDIRKFGDIFVEIHGEPVSHYDYKMLGEYIKSLGYSEEYFQQVYLYNKDENMNFVSQSPLNIAIAKYKRIEENITKKELTVTASISTKNRYDSTLGLTMLAIANQTVKPKKLVVWDDNDNPKDLREHPMYKAIFATLLSRGIDYTVLFGDRKGQVLNHQKMLDIAETDLIWRCFRGEEKVETIKGLKCIRNIEVGDLVKTHKGHFKPVITTYKTSYSQRKPLIWVNTKNNTVRCTPNHPFLVKDNNGDNKWVHAENITSDMFLLYPYIDKQDTLVFNCNGRKGVKIETLDVDYDLARFMGLYLAEGCGGHDSIRFTFNNNEKEYIDFIVRFCNEKFHRNPTIHTRWATAVKLNIRSLNFKFTEWFGNDATIKKIPEFVFNWSLKNKLAFLMGYLQGDGWKNCNMYCFGTASKQLYDDIKRLSCECGLNCTKKSEKSKQISKLKDGRLIKSKKSYQGSICTTSYKKMLDLLDGEITDNSYIKIPVINIEHKKMPTTPNKDYQYVYNLEVAEDNTYIVGSSIVHNCDDDNIPEPDVLEKLLSVMTDDVGAVAGCVFLPGQPQNKPKTASNKIKDIYMGQNIQWYKHEGVSEVEHLYSTFLYRKEAAKHGYNMDLSRVGHREETLLTYEMHRVGWKLLVNPEAVTWHLQESGGIRSFDSELLWKHDEQIFAEKMQQWGVTSQQNKIIVLNAGLGDQLAFLKILPELIDKYGEENLTLAVCNEEVFEDYNVKLISIAEAAALLGDLERFNLYKFMWDRNWKISMVDAYREMYL